MNVNILFITFLPSLLAVDLNFDPGLTIRKAAYWNPYTAPHNAYYFEDCTDSAGGICFGNEAPGAGFYTLSYDSEASYDAPCTPNTGMAIPYLEEFALIAGQPCPFYFYWGVEGSTFARLSLMMKDYTVDSRSYFGLQETLPGSTTYGGWPSWVGTPDVWSVRYVEFEYRAKVCYPSHIPDVYASGHIPFYLTTFNQAMNHGVAIRMNVLHFLSPQALANPPEWYYTKSWNEADVVDSDIDVWNLHGYMWGLSSDSMQVYVDPTPDCSTPVESAPWYKWTIDTHYLYNGLTADGHVDASYWNGAVWSGTILGGVETWGKASVTVDVRGYRVIG